MSAPDPGRAALSPAEVEVLRAAMLARGWAWGQRAYDLTLIGLRGPADPPDRYSDAVCLVYARPGQTVSAVAYRATTRPGLRALRENKATGGVFSLLDDYRHPLLWVLGEHHGRPALTHRPGAEARGTRDGDGDGVHDEPPPESAQTGADKRPFVLGRGINLHDPGTREPPSNVGNSSEGCVVLWKPAYVSEVRTGLQLQASARMGGAVSFPLLRTEGRPDLDAIRRRVAA